MQETNAVPEPVRPSGEIGMHVRPGGVESERTTVSE